MSKQIALSDKRRSMIFVNILICCVAGSMLATALNTALPPIMEDFQIGATTGQWLTSGYSLAMAIIMPLTAYLINRFPTKRLYCISIAVFVVGLVMSAAAVNFPMMMMGRIIQAAGNGMYATMGQVIILSIYPPEKRGTAMGWYGLSAGAAPVLAPTLAGILVDTCGWRMIFIASTVIMTLTLIHGLWALEDVLPTEKKRFKIASFILSGLAFGGLTLGIGNIGTYGFASVPVLAALAVGGISSAVFVYQQFHMDDPFLDLRLLKSRSYTVSVVGSMFLYFIMMGSAILLPLYVQRTLGLSATVSGLVTLPGSLTMAFISPFAGRIYDKIGIKVLFIGGAVILTLSNAGMYFITAETPIWVAAVLNMFRSFSIGCTMMPLVTWGAGSVGQGKTADATALLTSLRTIAGSIGSSVFVAIMTMVASSYAAASGTSASMHGINIAYLAMAGSGIAMLLFAAWGCKNDNKSQV